MYDLADSGKTNPNKPNRQDCVLPLNKQLSAGILHRGPNSRSSHAHHVLISPVNPAYFKNDCAASGM